MREDVWLCALVRVVLTCALESARGWSRFYLGRGRNECMGAGRLAIRCVAAQYVVVCDVAVVTWKINR